MNNMLIRALTGVLYIALLVGGMLGGSITFALLVAAIAALSVWEFTGLINRHVGASVNQLIATACSLSFIFALWQCCTLVPSYQFFLPFVGTVLYLLISELYRRESNPLKNWAFAFAAQLYITLPLSLIFFLAYRYDAFSNSLPYSWVLPLSVFIFLWTSDTGAYLCGSLLGRRFPARLFERISPKKSWVGSIGGGLLCLLAGVVLWWAFPILLLWQWLGLGLVVCVFGTWGDLVESLFKRQLGIKDSGRILPGHGGMLDRFDSALLAIPAAVFYLQLVG